MGRWGEIWAPHKSANEEEEGTFGCEAEQPESFLMLLLNDLSSYINKSVTVLVTMGIRGLRFIRAVRWILVMSPYAS